MLILTGFQLWLYMELKWAHHPLLCVHRLLSPPALTFCKCDPKWPFSIIAALNAVFQVILTGARSTSVAVVHWKIQPFCCLGFIVMAVSMELHNFLWTLDEPGIPTAKPLASNTFKWAVQLSKQCLGYLDTIEVLVYSLPEYTEVILLDFITVHCFMLYIQPLRKSEEDIIS